MMPSDEHIVVPLHTRLARSPWRDRVLVGAALVVVGLVVYQFVVTLLQPPWLGLATCWLLTVLAWLGLGVVGLFSGWASSAHLPASRSWWLISAALLCYALAQTLWLVSYVSSP